MPTLFIHGGAPKTGTSFLQFLFAKYAEQLAEKGLIYPRGHLFNEARAGEITSGNGVAMANFLRPELPHKIENKDGYLTQLEADLQSAAGKDVLYSSEYLIFPSGERSRQVVSTVRSMGYAPKYIYLVRDIGEAAFSTYSQQVKRAGETKTFEEYVKAWEPLYKHTLTVAAEAFGEENLVVCNYEEHSHRVAELLFRDILGVGFAPGDTTVINRSLSQKEAEIIRLMNQRAPGSVAFSTFISDALMSISRERQPVILTTAEADFLRKRFDNAVAYVNRFVRGRATVITSADTVRDRPPAAVNDFERAMIEIVGKIVATIGK